MWDVRVAAVDYRYGDGYLIIQWWATGRSIGAVFCLAYLLFVLGPGLVNGEELPTLPTPQHLVVLDTNNIQTSLHVTMATLQGVVNRKEPRIYLIWNWKHGQTDWGWLYEAILPKGVTHEQITDPISLVEMFKEELSGYIVYDPQVPHTINVATTMAGIFNATVVHPRHVAEFEQIGLHMVANLTESWTTGDTVEMYRWALETYWASCSHNILGSLEHTHHNLRDYLVACRAFTFYLDPTLPREKMLLEQILSIEQVKINTPIIGWFTSEVDGVRVASQHGCIVWAGDFAGSLTVHSTILVTMPLSQNRSTPRTLDLQDKVYVSFVISDGDNVQYDMNYMRNPLWSDPGRGKVPLGWTISPALTKLAPAIAEWYYTTASTEDYFLAGACGVGYMYPSHYPDLTSFTADSAQYMDMMDLKEIWLVNLFDEANKITAEKMMAGMDLNGIFESTVGPRQPTILLNGKPYFTTPIDIWIGDNPRHQRVESLANEIMTWAATQEPPCFIFVPVLAWGLDPSLLYEVKLLLGSDYEIVRPDELIALSRLALGEKTGLHCLTLITIVTTLSITILQSWPFQTRGSSPRIGAHHARLEQRILKRSPTSTQ